MTQTQQPSEASYPVDGSKNAKAAHAPESISDFAGQITKDYGHRPQSFKHDLAQASHYVNSHGFPGVEITGLQGHDLVGKNKDGKTVFIGADQRGGSTTVDGAAHESTTASGHKAKLAADGSGSYTVHSKDNGWSLSRDILQDRMKAAGIKGEPTANQVANFERDLGKLNGANWDKHLHEGQSVKVGSTVVGGDKNPAGESDGTRPTSKPGEVGKAPDSKGPDGDNSAFPLGPVETVQLRDPKSPVDPPGFTAGQGELNRQDGDYKPGPKRGEVSTDFKGELNDNVLPTWMGGSRTAFDGTKVADSKGMVSGHINYSGAGADFSIKNTDGTGVDLKGVKSVDMIRQKDGSYHATYVTSNGTYEAAVTGQGQVKKLAQTQIPGQPTTMDVPIFMGP